MAPHREPLIQVTCCMRVSLLSRLADVSAKGSLIPSRASEHGLLLRQSRSGWLPDFCSAAGGRVYWPTSTLLLLKVNAGVAVFKELVLVSDQANSCVEAWKVDL